VSRDGVSPTDTTTYLDRFGLKVEPAVMGPGGAVYIANKSERLARAARVAVATHWSAYRRHIRDTKSRPRVVRFCDGHISRATEIPKRPYCRW